VPGAAAGASAGAAAGADWEASGGGGAAASFAAVTVTTARHHTLHLRDVVVQAPISCADSPAPAIPVDVEVITANVAVGAGGAFRTGTLAHGAGTVLSGRISGRRVTLSYRHVARTANQFDGSTETCDTGTVKLTGAPGHRKALPDEAWGGQTVSGEPVDLNVVAGGRAVQEPPHPPANGAAQAAISFGQFQQSCSVGSCTPFSSDICAWETTETLFVGADGTFGNVAWQEGDQAVFTGRFRSAHSVTGTFTNGGQGCEETTWSATPG
jgi:hypothetical protein